jgi:hypothetical protein
VRLQCDGCIAIVERVGEADAMDVLPVDGACGWLQCDGCNAMVERVRETDAMDVLMARAASCNAMAAMRW